MKVKIIGNGVFGIFLKEIFAPFVDFSDEAEHVFLAVPIDAYSEVAAENKGKHLINICSVQHASNNICLEYSENVTGLHPLFGPRSPKDNRVSVLTHSCEMSSQIESLKLIVDKSAWVPKKFIPTSFQRLQNFVEQSGDFSPGTLSSIESNPFAED